MMMALGAVAVGLLMLTRVAQSAGKGATHAHRISQAEARAVAVIENIRSAPAAIVSCLATTATPNWGTCETQCRTLFGPDACRFLNLASPSDTTGQAFAIDTTKTSVTTGTPPFIQVSVFWVDDGPAVDGPLMHKVVLQSATTSDR